MIPIKIQCPCGQKFAFDVEPVDGRMPSAVACPACGVDGTLAGNEQIRSQLAGSAPAVSVKGKTLLLVGLTIAGVLLGGAGGAFFLLKPRGEATSPSQAAEPTSQTVSATPPTPATPKVETVRTADVQPSSQPAKPARKPSFVGVGALFDRDLTTKNVEITKVIAKSPAKKAGILVGDILIGVDGTPIQEMRLKEVADMVMGPVGSKVTLELISSKTGKTNRMEIVRAKTQR